jgi:hypothetical protein
LLPPSSGRCLYHGVTTQKTAIFLNSELQVTEFLKTLTLKDVAHSVGSGWGKIMPTTIANCWKKCIGKDDGTVDETKLIPFSKQDVEAACDALGITLQADDLASWIDVDEETPIARRLIEEDIAASVKNGKTTDELGASDTRSDSEDNGDDSCEVMVPKLNKVLENINEVMTWLEQQTDSEYLHLLHLVNIKKYVLKNAVISSDKLYYMTIFIRRHKCK